MESIRLMPALVQAERLVAGMSTEAHAAGDRDVEDARQRAEKMSTSELRAYLLGHADGSGE